MNKIDKVFVGGFPHSGKNILWRLLDGHPAIISHGLHCNIGYSVISEDFKNYFLKDKSAIEYKTYPFVPICNIALTTGEEVSIEIGEFFYALYKFSSYRHLYSWAKGKSMFVNMKEGENERFPFIFDINNFEKTLEKELFIKGKTFSEDEVLDVMYSSYILNCGKNNYINNVIDHNLCFVDTLPNGIAPLQMVVDKIPGAKIIVLKRDLISLIFAHASRIVSHDGEIKVDDYFKRIFFNLKIFEKKWSSWLINLSELEKTYNNVLVVDFNDLILKTDNTMRKITNFIDIQFEPILASPSINGQKINSENFQIIGKINDDPYEFLSEQEINLLKYLLYGFNNEYSVLKNSAIFFLAIKWRHYNTLKQIIRVILKFILPVNVFIQLNKFYYKMK